MAVHRKPSPYRDRSYRDSFGAPSDTRARDISGAIHPMHLDLARRMAAGPQIEQRQWSRPARLAFIFYAAVASWGLIGLAVYSVTKLI